MFIGVEVKQNDRQNNKRVPVFHYFCRFVTDCVYAQSFPRVLRAHGLKSTPRVVGEFRIDKRSSRLCVPIAFVNIADGGGHFFKGFHFRERVGSVREQVVSIAEHVFHTQLG